MSTRPGAPPPPPHPSGSGPGAMRRMTVAAVVVSLVVLSTTLSPWAATPPSEMSQARFQEEVIASLKGIEEDIDDIQEDIHTIEQGKADKADVARVEGRVDQNCKDIKEVEQEGDFEKYLYTSGLPDPDLVIRTSGEKRLSNFLIWQSAYSEFYVTDTLWPDFDEAELKKALDEYAKRERRFGG